MIIDSALGTDRIFSEATGGLLIPEQSKKLTCPASVALTLQWVGVADLRKQSMSKGNGLSGRASRPSA
jgi:hypothetical protein